MFSFVCLMLAISFGTWLLVLRPDIRSWLGTSWLTSKLSREVLEMRDTIALAVSLIAAVTSTTILIFVLFVSIFQYFK
jgi:hypothetical protein